MTKEQIIKSGEELVTLADQVEKIIGYPVKIIGNYSSHDRKYRQESHIFYLVIEDDFTTIGSIHFDLNSIDSASQLAEIAKSVIREEREDSIAKLRKKIKELGGGE